MDPAAPIRTTERVEAAGRMLAAGDVTAAESMLREVLEREPGHPDALNAFASLFLARNDGARAFEILGSACTAYPDHPRLLANLGIAHFMLGRASDAAICLERAIARAPGDAALRLALAQYRAAAGDVDRAKAAIETILHVEPDHPAALAQLGLLSLASGDRRRGEAALRRAAAVDPDNADVLANLSKLCGATGRHEEAALLAERAHLRAPLDLDRIVHLAGCRALLGDFERAGDLCKRVLVTAPEHLGATSLFARLAVARGAVESGISTLTHLVRRQPKNAEAILALVGLLRFAGRPAQALLFVEQALAIAPDHPNALNLRLELLLTLGRFADAWAGASAIEADASPPRVLAVPRETTLTEALLFGRFAADLGDDGLSLAAPAAATDILRRMPGIAADRAPEAGDPAVSLRDLPARLGTRRGDLGRSRPPIRPDGARLERWRAAFAPMRRPLIAIDWDPFAPGLLLRDLVPVVMAAGTPVSFATGPDRHQLRDWPRVIDAGVHVESVDDLLAAVACLDAFAGTDGLALHIAGSLHRPGVALAAAGHAWWMAADEDRLMWHPSLRSLRQARPGHWSDVLSALPAALAQALEQSEGAGQ